MSNGETVLLTIGLDASNPGLDGVLEEGEGHGADGHDLVMEGAQVELVLELLGGHRTQLLDFDLTHLEEEGTEREGGEEEGREGRREGGRGRKND